MRADGELSDEFWRRVPPTDAFVQREPEEGGVPSQRTEFRVAYDATTLFVKVRAFDTDAEQDRQLPDAARRRLAVGLDSRPGRLVSRQAHGVRVRASIPSGVKFDRYWYNDNNSDDSWDAVWDVKVSRDADGWTAEFRIPFSQLRFNPSESITFGFAVTRQIGRLNETIDVAAAGAQRQRLRVVVRRARRPVDERLAEAARGGAVHRRQPDAAATGRQPAARRRPRRGSRSAWT